jgi:hypothetical protein
LAKVAWGQRNRTQVGRFRIFFGPARHCRHFEAFERRTEFTREALGDRYLYAGLGTTLGVGANPRAESDRMATYALDESDLRSYRTLLAQSDGVNDNPRRCGSQRQSRRPALMALKPL